MTKENLIQVIRENPRIAAINNDQDLADILTAGNKVIYVLYGTITNIAAIVKKLKTADKFVFVNVDFVEGLAAREVSVDFILENTKADGIISSKATLVKAAAHKKMFAIQRSFMIDSKAFHTLPKQIENSKADIVDIQPGAMPKVLKWVEESIHVPIIASGLVCEEEDIQNALAAGALGVSSTNRCIWTNSSNN